MKQLCIGVLALQGDFAKHLAVLQSLGVEVKEVRRANDLRDCQGLIIPGGESTVIARQIDFIQMRDALLDFANNKPVFGTCAGLILMSKEIQGSSLKPLNILDVTVERNAFGRQVESFQRSIELYLNPLRPKLIEAFFIRAPRIRANGKDVRILAVYEQEPILIQQGSHLGATFHPELTDDPVIHLYFLSLCATKSS